MDYSNIKYIYRIITPEEWEEFKKTTLYNGNIIDRRSGFFHLSLASQTEYIAKKFYGVEASIILLKLDAQKLGTPLIFEKNTTDGDIFPHYYGCRLEIEHVIKTIPIANISEFDFTAL